MSFGEQMRRRREELGLTRQQLADRLGVSVSAVGNYETGISAPKEEVLLRLFDALEAEPNYLYRGSYRAASGGHSDEERRLLAKYRDLPLSGRQTVHTLVDALTEMTDDLRTAVPAADHQDIFHTRMNCHRHMNDHLIINKFVTFCQHYISVQSQHTAKFRCLKNINSLILIQ